jgi:hypothetical protein
MPLEQRIVFAVPGRLVQSMTRNKQYIGYEMLTDATATADHVIPQGSRYRILPKGELVNWDAYVRCCVRDGDLSEAPIARADSDDKAAKPTKKAEG